MLNQNDPADKGEAAGCHLGGDNGVPSISSPVPQFASSRFPILSQHWLRGCDMLEVLQ
jgi:hypothetical protein